MESYSKLYTKKIVDSIIRGLEQKQSSILFVKHYNTLNVPIDDIQTAVSESSSEIELLYHQPLNNRKLHIDRQMRKDRGYNSR